MLRARHVFLVRMVGSMHYQPISRLFEDVRNIFSSHSQIGAENLGENVFLLSAPQAIFVFPEVIIEISMITSRKFIRGNPELRRTVEMLICDERCQVTKGMKVVTASKETFVSLHTSLTNTTRFSRISFI